MGDSTVYPNVENVRVLSWNVLAQQLTYNMEDGRRVSAFEQVKDEYLEWKHRAPLFKQEFFKRDDKTGELFWDVICMQEFTCHKELFEGQVDGYVGVLMENGNKWTNAIYYNPAKFTLKAQREAKYKDPQTGENQGQGFVSVQLQCKRSQISFHVYTTHLKAKKGFERVREN